MENQPSHEKHRVIFAKHWNFNGEDFCVNFSGVLFFCNTWKVHISQNWNTGNPTVPSRAYTRHEIWLRLGVLKNSVGQKDERGYAEFNDKKSLGNEWVKNTWLKRRTDKQNTWDAGCICKCLTDIRLVERSGPYWTRSHFRSWWGSRLRQSLG